MFCLYTLNSLLSFLPALQKYNALRFHNSKFGTRFFGYILIHVPTNRRNHSLFQPKKKDNMRRSLLLLISTLAARSVLSNEKNNNNNNKVETDIPIYTEPSLINDISDRISLLFIAKDGRRELASTSSASSSSSSSSSSASSSSSSSSSSTTGSSSSSASSEMGNL